MLLLIATAITSQAQVLYINGFVQDSNQVGVPGVAVTWTIQTAMMPLTNTLLTDQNGMFSDSIPFNAMQGIVYFSYIDCNGNTAGDTLQIVSSPGGGPMVVTAFLSYCAAGGSTPPPRQLAMLPFLIIQFQQIASNFTPSF